MSIIYSGPVLPDDLTTYVRTIPQPANFGLSQYLPNAYVNTNRVDIGTILRTNRTARFRVFDGQVHRNVRDTSTISSVQLPPLSDELSMGEAERLALEYARVGGTNQTAFVDAVYNDADALTRYVQNRMELARGDVLMDGALTLGTINGEPALTADYGVPSGNKVTAGTLWSDHANSDPIGDITGWETTYINLNGFSFGGMILSRAVLLDLLANANIRVAAGTILGSALQLGRAQLDTLLADRGLPPILGVYDAVVDVDGTATRTTDAAKVVFVPPQGQPFGRTVWGVSATALELVNSNESDMTFENAPGIVGVVIKSDGPPFRQFTYVDSVGMPVIDYPNALFVATVR